MQCVICACVCVCVWYVYVMCVVCVNSCVCIVANARAPPLYISCTVEHQALQSLAFEAPKQ